MSDRNFKLRQMFCDYIYNPKAKLPDTSPVCLISGLTEADKKRLTLRKIVEEEEEVFETPQNFRPIILKPTNFDLKWIDGVTAENLKQPLSGENMKMGQRILILLEKSELLETLSMRSDEARHIQCYFMDDSEPPGEKLVLALDNLLTKCLTQLSQFSDKISVQIDLDIRRYFQDVNKAKCTIVETMLQHPHMMPEIWGRENAIRVRETITKEARKRDAEDIQNQKKIKEQKGVESVASAPVTPATPPTPTPPPPPPPPKTNSSAKLQKKKSDRTVGSFKAKKAKKGETIETTLITKEEKMPAPPKEKIASIRTTPITPPSTTPTKGAMSSPDLKPTTKPADAKVGNKTKVEKTSNVKNTSAKGNKQSKSKPTKTVTRKK